MDLSKVKPGDEVLVRVIVTESPRGNESWPVRGVIDGFSTAPGVFAVEAYFASRALVSHTPRALAVGDRVRAGHGLAAFEGPILAIHDGWAWLGDTEDSGVIRRLSGLERLS